MLQVRVPGDEVAGQVLQSAISSCCQHQYPLGDNLRCSRRVVRGGGGRGSDQAVSSFVAKLILPAPRLSESYHPLQQLAQAPN